MVWSLMTNHVHQQTQTLTTSLSKTMHRQGTGYAQYFNRRHNRQGHLFQNRYKSLLVGEEDYLFRLVRYVLLNPIRANIVADLDELRDYRWTSYPALMGRAQPVAFDVDFTLNLFGTRALEARATLTDWLQSGIDEDDELRLLVEPGRGRPKKGYDRRTVTTRIAARDSFVSGNPGFVADVLNEACLPGADSARLALEGWDVPSILREVCESTGANPLEVQRGRRTAQASAARAITAWMARTYLDETFVALSDALGVTPGALSLGFPRGEDLAQARCADLLAVLGRE
jgi:hypothetical protein